MSGDTPARDLAVDNWNKATDALMALDRKSKQGRITDHDALFELSHIVSYLVAAVGAMLVADAEKAAT